MMGYLGASLGLALSVVGAGWYINYIIIGEYG